MKQQILEMLTLQDQINTQVNANWRDQNFEWYRAIWVESAELLDHHGWKWWKKQVPDVVQVQLELVDIWHFALSMAMQEGKSLDLIAEDMAEGLGNSTIENSDFANALETFVSEVLGRQSFNVTLFGQLLLLADMPFEKLYSMYVGKNVLNRFRQDHGYKEGTYRKLWAGKEDNEHLAEVLEAAKSKEFDQGVSISDWVYQQLQQQYQSNH